MEGTMNSFNFGEEENGNEHWDKCKRVIIEVAEETVGKE
jgi:hypothetical protein